jgi:hypothetical protein
MATIMIGSGIDLKTVSVRLGHSTTAITNYLYVHPADARDQAAADRQHRRQARTGAIECAKVPQGTLETQEEAQEAGQTLAFPRQG